MLTLAKTISGTMPRQRKYSYRDHEVLLTCRAIMDNFVGKLDEFGRVRTNWNADFAQAVIGKIDACEAITNIKENASGVMQHAKEIHTVALRQLTFLKVQVEVDFEARRAKEVLNLLGYKKYLKNARMSDYKSLAGLLAQFRQNMTDELKREITELGTSQELIDELLGYAQGLVDKGLSPEMLEADTKAINQDFVQQMNEIYEQVLGICKIASRFFHDDKQERGKFVFSQVFKSLGLGDGTDEHDEHEEEDEDED